MESRSPSAESIAQYTATDRLSARIALHRDYSTSPIHWHRWLLEQMELPREAAVLDIGCGTGEVWRANADPLPPWAGRGLRPLLAPASWRVTLSDQSAAMAEGTAAALASLGAFTGHVDDIQALSFADASFDGVLACHMLYHVPDIAQGISELRRVLRPGGVLYAATNGHEHMQAMLDMIGELDPGVDTTHSGYRFTLENGEAPLRAAFDSVELRVFDDSLRVTHPQPLLDYILSMALPFRRLKTAEGQAAAFAYIQRRIEATGAIDIGKRSGVFVCR